MSISTAYYFGTMNLLHPELRSKPKEWNMSRGGWFNFFFPAEERINWYGNMIRKDSDGGKGMYATNDQYLRWQYKHSDGDIKIGPS